MQFVINFPKICISDGNNVILWKNQIHNIDLKRFFGNDERCQKSLYKHIDLGPNLRLPLSKRCQIELIQCGLNLAKHREGWIKCFEKTIKTICWKIKFSLRLKFYLLWNSKSSTAIQATIAGYWTMFGFGPNIYFTFNHHFPILVYTIIPIEWMTFKYAVHQERHVENTQLFST